MYNSQYSITTKIPNKNMVHLYKIWNVYIYMYKYYIYIYIYIHTYIYIYNIHIYMYIYIYIYIYMYNIHIHIYDNHMALIFHLIKLGNHTKRRVLRFTWRFGLCLLLMLYVKIYSCKIHTQALQILQIFNWFFIIYNWYDLINK